MVTVKESHFSRRLNPHLILKVTIEIKVNTWAYLAKKSKAVMWSRNLWFLLKRPNFVPMLISSSRPTLADKRSSFSLKITNKTQLQTSGLSMTGLLDWGQLHFLALPSATGLFPRVVFYFDFQLYQATDICVLFRTQQSWKSQFIAPKSGMYC